MDTRFLSRYHAAKLRIGLLGGSFNPAHEGHLHISVEALRRLGLDEVWWLTTAQNPLKSSRDTEPLEARLAAARLATGGHPHIKVTSLDAAVGSPYTYDLIRYLQNTARNCRFVWLIGADNLDTLPRWHRWEELFELLPIAVFDRENGTHRSLRSKAATRFKRYQVDEATPLHITDLPPPAWCFIHNRKNPMSSTQLRAQQQQRYEQG